MRCEGNFTYRGLNKTDAGSFVNDKGETINYDASYKLKVDEMTERGIVERVFKLVETSPLVPELIALKPYTDIVIEFEIQVFQNSCRLIPIAFQQA